MFRSSDQAASRDVILASAGLARPAVRHASTLRLALLASVLLPLANSPERQALARHVRITVKRHGTYEPIETCNSAPLGQLLLRDDATSLGQP